MHIVQVPDSWLRNCPGKVLEDANGDVAVDQYHRYQVHTFLRHQILNQRILSLVLELSDVSNLADMCDYVY